MTKFKPLRANVHVQLILGRPILQWQEVSGRFFNMIYEHLSPKFAVAPAEFSTVFAQSVGDMRARYNVFNGASAVTLMAERLAFDFPGLGPNELGLAREIIGTVYEGFQKAFPETQFIRIEAQSYEHMELIGISPAEFLSRFDIPSAVAAFKDVEAVVKPSMKFEAVGPDQNWQCSLAIEQSLLNAGAIFSGFAIALLKPAASFEENLESALRLSTRLLSAAELEQFDGTAA